MSSCANLLTQTLPHVLSSDPLRDEVNARRNLPQSIIFGAVAALPQPLAQTSRGYRYYL